MADYTENLNLKKPARTDYFSVADFNGNADIIDTAVGDLDTALDGKLNNDFSNISGGAIPVTAGGTGNVDGYIRTGQRSGTTVGSSATCEGQDTTASGNYSHAEGKDTKATGQYSHAEGSWGTASGQYSHVECYNSNANGMYSHASGRITTANYNQTVVGACNVIKGTSGSYTEDSGYFIVGCGINALSQENRANCFRVTETNTYGLTYNSSGADYAEMFEWFDGNIANEDRIGKFVTLDGDKIKLATSQDDYILGVVSGNPSVVGDSYDDQWAGMFEKDIYGRPVYEKVTILEEKDENGNVITPEHINDQLKISAKYKNTEEYIPRSKRKEWVAVGLLGKLICIDDGTAEINGYVSPNENSIATHSEEKTKYRVMKRIDETHIQIMIL